MGVIGAAAAAIATAVGAAISAAAVAVASVVSAVAAAVGAALSAVGSFVAGSLVGTLEGLSLISTATSANILSSLGALNAISVAAYGSAWATVSTISAVFTGFLEAIHFATIMKVHSIAMVVSTDYRAMMQGVYTRIGEVSRALGLGTHYINLVLRDARNIVLDVSTTLGKRYDLAEITWLTEMNNFLHKFQDVAMRYERRPYLLLIDIGEWIEKPAMDIKGSAMQAVILQLDGLLTTVDKTITTVTEYRDKVENLVSDLPEFMRKEIRTFTDPIIEKYDTYILKTVRPHIRYVDGMIDYLQGERAEISSRVGDIVNRLKKPGDYLRSIDRLNEWSRRQEEDKIAEVATRKFRRQARDLSKAARPIRYRHYKVAEALKYEPRKVEWFVEEISLFMGRPGYQLEPRETWFVGNY